MPLEDYCTIYDLINYDNADHIDFSKFCLINIDKSNDIQKLIDDIKHNKDL